MRQKLRSKATKESILKAASECFTIEGYDQTDVDGICRKANLTKGAFYYHFSSKQELFLELLEQWINRVAEKLDFSNIKSQDILRLISTIPNIFSSIFIEARNQLPVFLELYVKSITDSDLKKTVIKSYEKFIEFFTEMIEIGIDNGSIRKDIHPKDGAKILFSLTIGMVLQGLLRPRGSDWVDLSKKCIKILLGN